MNRYGIRMDPTKFTHTLVKVPCESRLQALEMLTWCEENDMLIDEDLMISGKFSKETYAQFYFENEEKAMAFKLRWL